MILCCTPLYSTVQYSTLCITLVLPLPPHPTGVEDKRWKFQRMNFYANLPSKSSNINFTETQMLLEAIYWLNSQSRVLSGSTSPPPPPPPQYGTTWSLYNDVFLSTFRGLSYWKINCLQIQIRKATTIWHILYFQTPFNIKLKSNKNI